jgi:hypothetical protein
MVHPLLADSLELITEAVANSVLANFDSKRRGEIFPSQDTKDVDVPNSIPVNVSVGLRSILSVSTYHFFVMRVIPS